MQFENLDIIQPIQKALKEEGYKNPTPIQEKSIPELLKGKDFLGCAQTGTGKTASFAIPILQNIHKDKRNQKGKRTIKAVILAPTRELAIQIGDSFKVYSRYMDIRTTVIFGGVSQNPQTAALHDGVDILVATPGRMIDLYNQKYLKLKDVKYFVLDEADSMLDMGMIHDVKRIIKTLPQVRQNIFFSATMPKEISKLVDSICKNPVKVEVAPVSSTVDTITQGLYFIGKKEKKDLLIHLLNEQDIKSVLVFSRTKHGANRIVKELDRVGIESAAIHGNKSQNARQLALTNFKEGKIRVLVATDIAARGIDIDDLSYVINYDLPECSETYVHRIGRTGRAGRSGIAMSFCCHEEADYHKSIEKLINKKIPVIETPKFTVMEPVKKAETNTSSNKTNNNGNRSSNRPKNRNSNNNRNNSNKNGSRNSSRSNTNKNGSSNSNSNRNSNNKNESRKNSNNKSVNKFSNNRNKYNKKNDRNEN